MSPPFIVRSTGWLKRNISKPNGVGKNDMNTGNIKTMNLKELIFAKLKSVMKSKRRTENRSPESSRSKSKSPSTETPKGGGNIKTPNELKVFTYAELRSATMDFKLRLLGEGGFGRVFMGWVNKNTYEPSRENVGMAVAIKKSNPNSRQGLKEWQSEIKFLGKLSHPNIIKLLGYCREDKEFLLVYEYSEKGSLDKHLFISAEDAKPLPWGIRLKIAIGAARGLAFLHASEKPIFYRDFKTSNILLDRNYNAKLSDFGLATDGELNENTYVTPQLKDTSGVTNGDTQVTTQIKCSNGNTQVTTQIKCSNSDTQVTTQISCTNGHTHVTTQVTYTSNRSHTTMGVAGTYGYAAPEYKATGHLNIKSDVYSFGVVVLELLTGRPAIDNSRPSGERSLVNWAKPLLSEKRKLWKIMDPLLLLEQYPLKVAWKIAQLALKCLESMPENRPSMVKVLKCLEQIDAGAAMVGTSVRAQSQPNTKYGPDRRTRVDESLKSLHSSRVCTSTLSSTAMVGTSVRAQSQPNTKYGPDRRTRVDESLKSLRDRLLAYPT